jgi:hypothetical protein
MLDLRGRSHRELWCCSRTALQTGSWWLSGTFEPSPKEYFQGRFVERCAPAHGFAPCIQASFAPLGAEYIGGQNYQKQKHGADVSARRTVQYSPLATTVLVADYRALGAVGDGRDRGGRSRIRLGDQRRSSSRHRSPSPRLRCRFHDD